MMPHNEPEPPWAVGAHPAPVNMFVTSMLGLMHQPRSWSKAEAKANIESIVVTPEKSQKLMSSLKDEAAKLKESQVSHAQNNSDMSVTPPVSQRLSKPTT